MSMVYAACVALFGEFLGRRSGLPDWPGWKRSELVCGGAWSAGVVSEGFCLLLRLLICVIGLTLRAVIANVFAGPT